MGCWIDDNLPRRGEHCGFAFKTMGDAYQVAFSKAAEAFEASLDAQKLLHSEEWEETGPLGVRMALHTGTAEERDGDYFVGKAWDG
jgi:class 3 adenylate cyclase